MQDQNTAHQKARNPSRVECPVFCWLTKEIQNDDPKPVRNRQHRCVPVVRRALRQRNHKLKPGRHMKHAGLKGASSDADVNMSKVHDSFMWFRFTDFPGISRHQVRLIAGKKLQTYPICFGAKKTAPTMNMQNSFTEHHRTISVTSWNWTDMSRL